MTAAWTPQPGPQLAAILADWCPELFFGGARGGGKSEFLIGDYLQGVPEYGPNWQGILVRRSFPELQEVIKRTSSIYPLVGAEWKEGAKEWRFPNGAVLRLRFLENYADTMHYQGHEYQWIGDDELPNWPNGDAYFAMNACLRCSKAEVKKKRRRSTGNPGGVGHHWVKQRFIDPAPNGYKLIYDENSGAPRLFIPSRVQDNKILLERDPEYINRLKTVGNEALVRGWLEGDWTIIAGAFFTEFGPQHILRPFEIPEHWMRFRAYDHGSSKPFWVGWAAVSDGTQVNYDGRKRTFPAGFIVWYREWYGCKENEPNTGLKLQLDAIADGIRQRDGREQYAYSVADTSIFDEDSGPSLAEEFRKRGVYWRPADKKRKPGWQQFRDRLIGMDAEPMTGFFDTCTGAIRCIPAAQHDKHDAEDVDTNGEDHPLDGVRYGFMSRPWVRPAPAKAADWKRDLTTQELLDLTLGNKTKYRRI